MSILFITTFIASLVVEYLFLGWAFEYVLYRLLGMGPHILKSSSYFPRMGLQEWKAMVQHVQRVDMDKFRSTLLDYIPKLKHNALESAIYALANTNEKVLNEVVWFDQLECILITSMSFPVVMIELEGKSGIGMHIDSRSYGEYYGGLVLRSEIFTALVFACIVSMLS